MYATPNIRTRVYVVKADRNTPGFMRSPPEVPYMYALESAMNEMADRLGMDPVEFRRINDTDRNPVNGARYTSRSLMKCYDEASAAFGWRDREAEPGQMRDGDWLIGWGCATACYPTQMDAATARVRLTADGRVRVETARMTSAGAYTVIAQMAAGELGVPMQQVEVKLGDSRCLRRPSREARSRRRASVRRSSSPAMRSGRSSRVRPSRRRRPTGAGSKRLALCSRAVSGSN